MKKNILNSAALAIMLTIVSVAIVNAQDSGGGRLAGAWDAAVTIRNCETGAPIRTFLSLATFNQGGTFSGITSGIPPAPVTRSPELGVWKHIRGDHYAFRFKAFLFDAAGVPTGYQVVTHEVLLDADNLNYTSAGGVQIFNMAGTQGGTGCSTAVGTRMVLE